MESKRDFAAGAKPVRKRCGDTLQPEDFFYFIKRRHGAGCAFFLDAQGGNCISEPGGGEYIYVAVHCISQTTVERIARAAGIYGGYLAAWDHHLVSAVGYKSSLASHGDYNIFDAFAVKENAGLGSGFCIGNLKSAEIGCLYFVWGNYVYILIEAVRIGA